MADKELTLPGFAETSEERDYVALSDKTYLLAISGKTAGTVITLHEGDCRVGREEGAHLVLNDTQVSRLHAQFTMRHSEVVVKDLGSTNGTYVNGTRIKSSRVLAEGDEVQIGSNLFKFSHMNPVDGGRVGLLTHGYFENRLGEELDRAHRYKRPLSILMVRIQGEEEKLLYSYYPKIVAYIRKMIRGMDLLAHYGKFELELLLPETDKREATLLANRIATEKIFDRKLYLSVGVATFPGDAQSRDDLVEKARSALKKARSKKDSHVAVLSEEIRHKAQADSDVVIRSDKMAQIFELATRIARSTITVLIQGETGVGKEVMAETIHKNSERASKALVCVNCAAITETLLESELFGHEKGSFTGADHLKIGLFETAKGGTIFLDEVGEMPLKTQAKLLRVLQAKKIMRVGSTKETDVDVRVVAATNRKLEDLVAKGQFREDLYYRLNAATITVPPLRERKDEIPHLAEAFIQKVSQENGIPPKRLNKEAIEHLLRYPWPGNIRELRNTIERAVVISDGDEIGADVLADKMSLTGFDKLDMSLTEVKPSFQVVGETQIGDMREVIGSYERQVIVAALKKSDWNQTKAADLLHIPRRTLVSKIKKYHIKRD